MKRNTEEQQKAINEPAVKKKKKKEEDCRLHKEKKNAVRKKIVEEYTLNL